MSWYDKLAPTEPAPWSYSDYMAQLSGSAIYQPRSEKQRADLYKDSPVYGGLQSYMRDKPDPLAKRENESEENWQRRTAPHRRAAEQAAEAEAAQQAWAEHRTVVDNITGTGSGIYGNASPQERATTYHSSLPQPGRAASTYSGAQVTPGQGVPMSTAEVMQIVRAREAAARGQIPQHQNTSTLSSSGTGFLGVDR